MKTMTPSMTFRQIAEESRAEAAANAWSRALQASRLRHLVARVSGARSSEALMKLKEDALKRVQAIVPEEVQVTVDDDYHVGCVSVRWRGQRMHLPPATAF